MAKQPTIKESVQRRRSAMDEIMKEQEKSLGTTKKPAPKAPAGKR